MDGVALDAKAAIPIDRRAPAEGWDAIFAALLIPPVDAPFLSLPLFRGAETGAALPGGAMSPAMFAATLAEPAGSLRASTPPHTPGVFAPESERLYPDGMRAAALPDAAPGLDPDTPVPPTGREAAGRLPAWVRPGPGRMPGPDLPAGDPVGFAGGAPRILRGGDTPGAAFGTTDVGSGLPGQAAGARREPGGRVRAQDGGWPTHDFGAPRAGTATASPTAAHPPAGSTASSAGMPGASPATAAGPSARPAGSAPPLAEEIPDMPEDRAVRPSPVEMAGLMPSASPGARMAVEPAVAAGASTDTRPAPQPVPQIPLASLGPMVLRAAARGEQHLLVRIEPPALGQVEIGLRLDAHGRLEVTLRTRREEALERLRAETPDLERLLEAESGAAGAVVRLECAADDAREEKSGRRERPARLDGASFARLLQGLVDITI